MTHAVESWDVAIVGAGPAGAATAMHLNRAGHKVVVVDRATFPRDKPCAEYLSPAAEPLLRDLGVLADLELTRPGRLRGFRIYAPHGRVLQGDFAGTRDSAGKSLFETGLVIPRLRLDAAIVNAARAEGITIREGWRLGQIAHEDDGTWLLTPTSDDAPLRARLVIAADGLHSTIARRLGLHVPSRMRKIALVAHVRGITGLGDYGEMHVANRRYVGLAPMEPSSDGDLCNVAMVVDEKRDGRKLAGHPQAFLLEALETFPMIKGRLKNITFDRRTLTISRLSVHAKRLSDEGLLLVGDAAGYYDPFTGEGIYRALRGAEMATSVALPALAAGDLSARRLTAYDRLHRAEFRGKRMIEMIIQSSVQVPPLMDHIALRLGNNKAMADTIVAVTGDFLPTNRVLRPGYLLRLL